jgi:hypothetical protein
LVSGGPPRRRNSSAARSDAAGAASWSGFAPVCFDSFSPEAFHRDRQVQVARSRKIEQALKENLARGRFEQIRAANDVGYTLFRIVDDERELVRKYSVRPQDDEVADFALDDCDRSPCMRSVKRIGWSCVRTRMARGVAPGRTPLRQVPG